MEDESESFAGVILKASSLIFVCLIIQRVFGYFFNSILTKTVSQADYGGYTFAWSVAMFATGIFLLGMPHATSRYIAYYRGKDDAESIDSVIKTGFTITVLLTFIATMLFIGVTTLFPTILSLTYYLTLFTLSILIIWSIGSFFSHGILTGYRRPEISGFFAMLHPVLSVTFILIVVFLGYGFTHVLAAITLAFLISNLFAMTYALKNYRIKGKIRWEIAKKLLAFGVPIVAIDTSNNLLAWADIFLIKLFRGFSDLGIYWASTITANLLLLFSQPLISIFSPIVAELFGKKDTQRLSFMISYLIERYCLLTLPILTVFIIFPSGILKTIFTEDYTAGTLPLQIYSTAMLLYGLSTILQTVITGSGKPRHVAQIIIIAAIVNVILNLILIKPYGITGASTATLCSSSFILTASYLHTRKIIKFTMHRDRYTKILTSLTATITVIYMIKLTIPNLPLALTTSIITLPVTYLTLLLTLRALREEDLTLLEMILQKMKIPADTERRILKVLKKGVS